MLGPNDRLYVTVTSYEPHVDCNPTPIAVPSKESCQYLLSMMPAGQNLQMFGTDKFDRSIIHLPKVYDHGQ